MPLNRLVDAARPESAVARRFAELVGNYIERRYKDSAGEAQIRAWLVKWQGNHPTLKPQVERSGRLDLVVRGSARTARQH